MLWHRALAHTVTSLHANSQGALERQAGPALDVGGVFGAAGRPLLGGGVLGAGTASSTGCSSSG